MQLNQVAQENKELIKTFTLELIKAYSKLYRKEDKKTILLERIQKLKTRLPQQEFFKESALEAFKEKSVIPLAPTPLSQTQVQLIPLIIDAQTNETIVSADIREDSYYILEPYITLEERKFLDKCIGNLKGSENVLGDKTLLLRAMFKAAVQINFNVNENDFTKYKYYVVRDLISLSSIEPLLHDPLIEKIICEGAERPVIVIRERVKYKTNIIYKSEEELSKLVLLMASRTFKQIDDDNPFLDAVYKKFRIQAVLGSSAVPSKFIIIRT